MKSYKKILGVVVAILLLVPLYFIGSYVFLAIDIMRRNIYGDYLISKIDPKELVADCQMMIDNRGKYRNDSLGEPNYREGETALSAEKNGIGTNVPLSIRKLNPDYILIRTNQIQICLTAPVRTKIVGFPAGVEGYGTQKLTNGLWRWGGPVKGR